MLLRWMMEGKIIVGTVDLLTVLMIVLLSLDGRLVAPGGARSSMPKKGWSERSAGRQCIVLPLQLCIKTFTVLVGNMENRIKEQQLDLFADRTSTHWMASNQLRLWFSAFAHLLISTLRAWVLRGRARTGLHRPDPAATF